MDPTSWFVRPKTRRLSLSDDQWILVKERLTTGEYRAHLKRSSSVDDVGIRRIDTFDHATSLVVTYLVDWSLIDAGILGSSEADIRAAVDALDPDRFTEIKNAIERHEAAMQAERTAEKNGQGGGTVSSAISPSPSGAAGAWTGSETLT